MPESRLDADELCAATADVETPEFQRYAAESAIASLKHRISQLEGTIQDLEQQIADSGKEAGR
jgi:predicted  nucleic acid-binding Zn-ribbon protein